MNLNKLNNQSIEDIQLKYGYGDCAVFAAALSEFYELPIVEFYANNEMYHVALVIEGQNIDEDQFIDVFGINSFKDIKQRYTMRGKQSIEVKTKKELHITSCFNEEDIEVARKDILFMLKINVLPIFESLKICTLNPTTLKLI